MSGPEGRPIEDPVAAGLAQSVEGVWLCASCAEPLADPSGATAVAHWKDRHGLVEALVIDEPAPEPTGGPIVEGLAVIVETGAPAVQLLACTECGVLLWDVEAHWTDAHAHRLQALRAMAARG